MRLIDADVLCQDIASKMMPRARGNGKTFQSQLVYVMTMIVTTQPIIDAVEVVRCKDCKHYYFAENRVPEEQSWVCDVWHVNQTAHMGYCFKAERRSE